MSGTVNERERLLAEVHSTISRMFPGDTTGAGGSSDILDLQPRTDGACRFDGLGFRAFLVLVQLWLHTLYSISYPQLYMRVE